MLKEELGIVNYFTIQSKTVIGRNFNCEQDYLEKID